MDKARVLLDTNILISGLVFAHGNEHAILRMIEERELVLVLPETVLMEVKRAYGRFRSPSYSFAINETAPMKIGLLLTLVNARFLYRQHNRF